MDFFLGMAVIVAAICLPLICAAIVDGLQDYYKHKEELERIRCGKKEGEPETKNPNTFYYSTKTVTKNPSGPHTHPTRGAKS